MKKKNIIIIAIAIILLVFMVVLGICGNTGKQEKYQLETVKQYNYFVLKQENSYGVIDRQGNIVIPSNYSEIKIPNPEKPLFVCYQEKATKLLNEKNEKILDQYNNVEPIRLKNISSDLMYEKSVLKYEQDGKYGLINFSGKKITEPIYEEIDSLPYKEGELIVKQNEKYGVINIQGKQLIESKYDEVKIDEYYVEENQYRYAGYIVVNKTQEGYRYGYINYEGEEILDTKYNEIVRIGDIQDKESSYLICAQNGQYGINKNKDEILNYEYQSIQYDKTNQIFILEKGKKYGIADLKGKIIVPIQYNQIDSNGNYLYAKNDKKTTIYNKDGTQVDMSANIAILNTSNENYKIKINNEKETKYGVVNKDGKKIIEEKYDYIEYLHDNYFIVSEENGKLGILDEKGNFRLEKNQDSIQKVPNTNLIQVTTARSKVTQIYSKTIEKICEMEDATIEVKNEYVKIYNEQETKYFSKEGKELRNTEIYTNNKLFVSSKNGQYGFVDKSGNVVVDFKYDKACEFNSYGFAAIQKDGKWGVINEEGKEIAKPIYELKDTKEPIFIGSYYRVTYGFGEFYYTDAK